MVKTRLICAMTITLCLIIGGVLADGNMPGQKDQNNQRDTSCAITIEETGKYSWIATKDDLPKLITQLADTFRLNGITLYDIKLLNGRGSNHPGMKQNPSMMASCTGRLSNHFCPQSDGFHSDNRGNGPDSEEDCNRQYSHYKEHKVTSNPHISGKEQNLTGIPDQIHERRTQVNQSERENFKQPGLKGKLPVE